jgi:predicted double-glycine peptidase
MPILLRAVLRGLLVISLFVGTVLFLRWLALRYLSKGDAKKTEKIHAINCLIFDSGIEIGEFIRQTMAYTPKAAKLNTATLAGAAAVTFGLNLGKLLDPRKQVADLIKSELTLTYQELNRAIDNANEHGCKEAIEYIADSQAALEAINPQMNPDDSIAETISTIRAIRANAKLISEAGSFDGYETVTNNKPNPNSPARTFYDVLGISREATDDEIKSAYRILAQIYHPDKYATLNEAKRRQMEEEFKMINEAYSTLSNPRKKADYDRQP